MNANDSLVLHLIKHLVRKNDEFSINKYNNGNTILNQEKSEDFKDYFLQQLDVLQKKFVQLKQEVLEYQPQKNYLKPTEEKNTLNSVQEVTASVDTNQHSLTHQILLSPEKELSNVLPQSLFVHNGDINSNFGVETKDKLIFLYFFRIKDAFVAKDFSLLLHFITNKIILSLQKPEVLDLFKEFDKKILDIVNNQPNTKELSNVDFAFCVINKTQAKLDMVSSGIDLLYEEQQQYTILPSDSIRLGNHETHLIKANSVQIKRGNTYFMIPSDLVENNEPKQAKNYEQVFKSFEAGNFAERRKKLNDWIKTQQKSQFVFSFGF